jgi:hypothetical protein
LADPELLPGERAEVREDGSVVREERGSDPGLVVHPKVVRDAAVFGIEAGGGADSLLSSRITHEVAEWGF